MLARAVACSLYGHHPVGMLIRGRVLARLPLDKHAIFVQPMLFWDGAASRWSRRPRPPLLLWVLRRLYEHAPTPCKLGNMPRKANMHHQSHWSLQNYPPAAVYLPTAWQPYLCNCGPSHHQFCGGEGYHSAPSQCAHHSHKSNLPAGQYAFER